MGKTSWRPEPISVEKLPDELWIGVKCQSNQEIAGSPRNSFRASVVNVASGGRALFELGGQQAYRTHTNSECR